MVGAKGSNNHHIADRHAQQNGGDPQVPVRSPLRAVQRRVGAEGLLGGAGRPARPVAVVHVFFSLSLASMARA